jgi:hypothetical protein
VIQGFKTAPVPGGEALELTTPFWPRSRSIGLQQTPMLFLRDTGGAYT